MLAHGALFGAIQVASHVHHVACIKRMGVVPDGRVALVFLVVVPDRVVVIVFIDLSVVIVVVRTAQYVVPGFVLARFGVHVSHASVHRAGGRG